jgi:3-hydroxyisobutyrate dehydrogenase
MTSRAKVAVVGTGLMGAPIARRLARAGFGVTAWNRTAAKAEALAADGVRPIADAEEAAAGAGIVLTMLADGPALLDVVDRDPGPLTAAAEGAVWLQMSSVGLQATSRCIAVARARGIAFVDAPVVGTTKPAQDGQLIVLASGDQDAIARCEPVLSHLAARTLNLGPAGAGTRLKVVVNAWVMQLVEALAETLFLSEALDVDPLRFLEAIQGTQVDAGYAQVKGRQMLAREFDPAFPLSLALKDVELALTGARAQGLGLPLLDVVRDRMAQAVAAGHGAADMSAAYMAGPPRCV